MALLESRTIISGCVLRSRYGMVKTRFSKSEYSDSQRANIRANGQGKFELLDTSVFDQNRYFDIFVEYAKLSPEDLLIQIKITNRAAQANRFICSPHFGFVTLGLGGNRPKNPASKC